MSYICSKKLNNKRNKNIRLSYGKETITITLMDYSKSKVQVEIPSNTKEIDINIISGDTVMTSPIYFDANVEHDRRLHCFDGSVTITADKFAALAGLESPYDIFELDD